MRFKFNNQYYTIAANVTKNGHRMNFNNQYKNSKVNNKLKIFTI